MSARPYLAGVGAVSALRGGSDTPAGVSVTGHSARVASSVFWCWRLWWWLLSWGIGCRGAAAAQRKVIARERTDAARLGDAWAAAGERAVTVPNMLKS